MSRKVSARGNTDVFLWRKDLKKELLECLAKKAHTQISNLRLVPHLKWAALRDLYCMKHKEQYPLKEWGEAVSYLLGCTVTFNSYEEITNSLKPFSLGWE